MWREGEDTAQPITSAPWETYYRGRPVWELVINLERADIVFDAPETDNCGCLVLVPVHMAFCVYNRKRWWRQSNGERRRGRELKKKKGGWQKRLSSSLQLTSKLLYKDSPRQCIFMLPLLSPASLLLRSSYPHLSSLTTPLFLFHTYPSLQPSPSFSPLLWCLSSSVISVCHSRQLSFIKITTLFSAWQIINVTGWK